MTADNSSASRPRTPTTGVALAFAGCIGLSVVVVALAVAGLQLIRVDLPINQVPASIALAPTADGRVIRVAATTDLPDGARIFYYFYHERNDVEWTGGLPPYNVQGYAVVADGQFEFKGDLREWPAGAVTIWAEFAVVDDQPAHIEELFGPNGERLGGPQVRYADSEDYKILYVETAVTLT